MKERIDGRQFAAMVLAAAAAVDNERQLINDLNVFPVPDGDTGTNMSLTLQAAAKALQTLDESHAGRVAELTASAVLRGARGNSGVILSLLFRGIGKSLKDKETVDGAEWAAALHEGVETAYGAVMKPAEGTMLTVSRMAAAHCLAVSQQNNCFEFVAQECVTAAEEALAETIFQNPVLEKAGVIDSGGKGLCIAYEAMLQQLQGTFKLEKKAPVVREKADFSDFDNEEITFLYCTEFIILRDSANSDVHPLRTALDAMGDSMVFVDDESIIKVHLHTDHPGKAIEKALTLGQLTAIKIENMREQHTEKVITQDAADEPQVDTPQAVEAEPKKLEPVKITKPYGFVAVVAGDGVASVYRDLGADALIEGGQTMNPSTDDIVAQINATPAETVFVLPNNKNIIMAADQAVPLCTTRQVIVVPTKTIAMGIGALMAFDPDSDASANATQMMEAASAVSTGQITYAARNSTFDGRDISEGDHMALLNGQLVHNEADRLATCAALAGKMAESRPSFITIFYGEGVEAEEAEKVEALYGNACPDAEISIIDGGQPVYYYLISAE